MADQSSDEKAERSQRVNGAEHQLNRNQDAGGQTESPISDEKPSKTAQPSQQLNGQSPNPSGAAKMPSKLKQAWDKLGLDFITVSMMFKGSIPPTVALAMYQADPIARTYGRLGYLVAISSILGFCIMPRGKFIQHMFLSVTSICLAAAINLLALYCATQARLHTTPPGQPPTGYNSSASAVCAIWLIVQIYFINVVRAARPQFQFPSILCSIFVVVGMTYGTLFPNMSYAISFMEQLLEAFLTGFGLATATHILVFPTSSRMVVFKELTGYLSLLNGVLKTQTAYMASLENHDPLKKEQEMEKAKAEAEKSRDGKKKQKKNKDEKPEGIWTTPASTKMQELLEKLVELHTKLHGDITPAKREIAIGKLESHDLTEIWKLSRNIFLPVLGLSSMIRILERGSEIIGWRLDGMSTEEENGERRKQVERVQEGMRYLHQPFAEMSATLDGAFNHILLTLELVPTPKKKKQVDEESKGDGPPAPGTPGFAEAYKTKVEAFHDSKKKTLENWCKENGIELPPDFWDSSFDHREMTAEQEHRRDAHQRQLFFVLYLEYLLWRVAKSVMELVLYADKRKQQGAFARSKVIFPGSKTLYKWLKSTLGREDFSHEDSFTTDMDSSGSEALYLGQAFGPKKRDPEHEVPRNGREKLGEKMRLIPRFFRSDASAFAFRVVAATMTLGIVCYLRQTQEFFIVNRLLWAMIMIAMSMNRTAGQSIFNYVARTLGTAVAMIAAFLIWYIPAGHTAGVLVFQWLWIMLAFYPVFKMPKYTIVAILGLVTSVLIIGYELQVRKTGVKSATANGQPYYKVYVLAPYRLATVAAGLFVAFIWTIFPYPISESSELRKDLAVGLNLMSAYYENSHETVQARVKGRAGRRDMKGSHAYNLDKSRLTIFSKLIFVLETLKTNSAFSKFQIHFGGRFPHEQYEELINCMRRLLLWISLATYTSIDFDAPTTSETPGHDLWASQFRKVIGDASGKSHQITSLLSLLSFSLSSGQPLPPYLAMPEPFQFVKMLNRTDKDLVSIRHIAEPEYSAFAVMQVASQCINTDIRKLTMIVKNLVGEIDFSYHAIKSSSASTFRMSPEDSEDDEKEKPKAE